MLKKANQKRLLDNVIIQEGEFTTDYFQKMDWRDMLGEEELAKIGDLAPATDAGTPQDLSTVHGADLEQALAAAEDENDVLAMHQAKHEMEGVDVSDFSDAVPAATSPSAGSTSLDKGSSGTRVQFAGAESIEEEYGEVIEMGHVDEYMLRFMEREYGHYVGFGGLPEPVKTDIDGDLEMEGNNLTEELSEAENEDEEEEEEEEEEDEYDVEDSGSEAEDSQGASEDDESSEKEDEEGEEDGDEDAAGIDDKAEGENQAMDED